MIDLSRFTDASIPDDEVDATVAELLPEMFTAPGIETTYYKTSGWDVTEDDVDPDRFELVEAVLTPVSSGRFRLYVAAEDRRGDWRFLYRLRADWIGRLRGTLSIFLVRI